MRASDVMVTPVITVKSNALVRDVAKLLLAHRISAVPVVDEQGMLVGIVSEGDLIHRSEIGTERQRPRWLVLVADERVLAADYIKAHAGKVADVMTRNVITASPDTPLHEIARLMERNAVKRIPIMSDGQLIGIVSRANLVQAVASSGAKLEIPLSDTDIRNKLMAHLNTQRWAHTGLFNAAVNDGVIDLWGFSSSETERRAIRVAAETTPGARVVNDHMVVGRIGFAE